MKGPVDESGVVLPSISVTEPEIQTYTLRTVCGDLDWTIVPNFNIEPDFILPEKTPWCGNGPVVELCDLLVFNVLWDGVSTACEIPILELGPHILSYSTDCVDYEFETLVTVCDMPPKIYSPNIFSPNGDGVNDEFEIHHLADVIPVSLTVFDRWGNTIAKGFKEWDGDEAIPGVYIYRFEYLDLGGATNFIAGDVTLIK